VAILGAIVVALGTSLGRLPTGMVAFARDEARERRLGRQRGDRDLRVAVATARRRGASWAEIGEVLRITAAEAEDQFSRPPRRRPRAMSKRREELDPVARQS
jgi:hypothetical protein